MSTCDHTRAPRAIGLDVLNTLCDALGLPKTVRRLTIDVDLKEAVIMTAEMTVTRDESDVMTYEVSQITKTYQLVEKPDEQKA